MTRCIIVCLGALAAGCFDDPAMVAPTSGATSTAGTEGDDGAATTTTSADDDAGTTAPSTGNPGTSGPDGSGTTGPLPDTGTDTQAVPCEDDCFTGVCDADGRCERLVFVTAVAHSANFGGAEGGDALCQDEADGAGLGDRYFRALLATNNTPSSAFMRLGPDAVRGAKFVLNTRDATPIIDANALALAGNDAPPLQAPIDRDASGATVTPSATACGDMDPMNMFLVWTGLKKDTMQTPLEASHCQGWSGRGKLPSAGAGRFNVDLAEDNPRVWARNKNCSCGAPAEFPTAHLYCFEVPPPPE